MSGSISFGLWLSRRRKALDLTQEGLARRVGCSLETIKKIEESKRRPSKQVAELLAQCLEIPLDEHAAFIKFSRAEAIAQPQIRPPEEDSPPTTEHPQTQNSKLKTQNSLTNLPAQVNAFIGREKEVASVCDLLRRPGVRLLTLTGPPGIGKTRLSLQAAASLLGDFGDGVFFIAMAPVTDPRLVASAIAQALGVREAAPRSLLESLKSHLRDKQMLLVVDNFEQVVSAAPLLVELLEAAPDLKILASSRIVLHVYGEHELQLPPLALPDRKITAPVERLMEYESMQLFVARSVAARPDFALTGDNAQAVTDICHRLDGLPLAIELAAARIKLFSPQTILDRLKASGHTTLQAPAGGPKNLPARQRTLRAAVAWSYDLLDAWEQALFRRLGVFVGGCTPEAVESVVSGQWSVVGGQTPQPPTPNPQLPTPTEIDILDGLYSLVDKSLLRYEEWDGKQRFWMLYTLREYALWRLEESGEVEEIGRRHADYFLDLAESAEPELKGPNQGVWLGRLAMEQANLLAALEWSLSNEIELAGRLSGALWHFWLVRGFYGEGRQWLEAVLAHSTLTSPIRAKALHGAGVLALYQGDLAQAVKLLEESLRIRRELRDKGSIALSLNALGVIAHQQSDYARAKTFYEESLALKRELGDVGGIADSLSNLGLVARNLGDYEGALLLHEESLALNRELGDKGSIAASLGNLALVAFSLGDYKRAMSLHEESLALFRELGDKGSIAFSLSGLGKVAEYQGEYEKAKTFYDESLLIERELGDRRGIAGTLFGTGHLAQQQHDYERAGALFAESLALFREVGDKTGLARCLEGLASLLAAQGQAEQAAVLFGASSALREASGAAFDPVTRSEYERNLVSARAQLDEASWSAAWEQGRAMSLERAVDMALSVGQS